MSKLECLEAQLKLATTLVKQEIDTAKSSSRIDWDKVVQDGVEINYTAEFIEKHSTFGLSPTLFGRRVLNLITETKLQRVCVPYFELGVIITSKKGLTKRQLRAVLNNLEDGE